MNAQTLRRVLEATLLTASGSGCLFGSSGGSSSPPQWRFKVVEASPEAASAPPDARGFLHPKVCARTCWNNPEWKVCYLATIRAPERPKEPRRVDCNIRLNTVDDGRTLPDWRSAELPPDLEPSVGPTGEIDLRTCRMLCEEPARVMSCSERLRPPPVRPDEKFVVCGQISTDTGGGGSIFGSGRVPRGLRRERSLQGHAAAMLLARAAHLEHASVFAFERMALELRSFGAPESLARRARAAARDERRHAAMMAGLARRFGARVSRARVRRQQGRGLAAFALENAVEGCVRETFGALIALYQANAAADRGVRDAMRSIASDEIRHAALSWSVWAWCAPRLSDRQRARVHRAMIAASQALCVEHPVACPEIGLPPAPVAHALALTLFADLGRA